MTLESQKGQEHGMYRPKSIVWNSDINFMIISDEVLF